MPKAISLETYQLPPADLTDSQVLQTMIINSPRSLVACRRLRIDVKQLVNPRIDENTRRQQLAFAKQEYSNVRVNGMTREEFQQLGAPPECAAYINNTVDTGSSAQIERILQKQKNEMAAADERFRRQQEFQLDQERKRAEQERQQALKDQRRQEQLQETQAAMKQRLQQKQEKNRREQEQAAATIQANQEALVRKMAEEAIKRENLIITQRREKQERLRERTLHHGDKMAKSQAFFAKITQAKTEKNLENQRFMEERLSQQKTLLHKQQEERRARTESKLKQIKENVQKLQQAQEREGREYLNALECAQERKTQAHEELKAETSSHFRAKADAAIQKAKKSLEEQEAFIKQKEERLEEKFKREQRNAAAARRGSPDAVARSHQRIANQRIRMAELEELRNYNQAVRDSVQRLRAQKNDEFVRQREILKDITQNLATKHQAEKEIAMFEKYYGVGAGKWKTGQAPGLQTSSSPTRTGVQSPTRFSSPPPRQPAKGPSKFMLQKQGISQLNQLIEREDKRELQRQAELRNARTEEERREMVERHRSERINTAKKLDDLRTQLSKSLVDV